jgi:hypothetical protein
MIQAPPSAPRWRGSLSFQAEHPLWDQLLFAGKAAEMAGAAVLDRRQQAQGKHANECRGMQPEIADSIDLCC